MYLAITRIFRRRLVLGIVVILLIVFGLLNFIEKNEFDTEAGFAARRTHPFVWRTLQEHNTTDDVFLECRNSVQGQNIVVDDRGYLCNRPNLLRNGCCNNKLENVAQYACNTCNSFYCCEIFEECVSCCLDPEKKEMLEGLLLKAAESNRIIFAAVSDHFELCLTKCRTNSESVHHENTYKNPKSKFCFGETPPNSANNEKTAD